MMNMRGVMPALMKAPAANVGVGGIAYGKVEVPRAKRDTVEEGHVRRGDRAGTRGLDQGVRS